MKTTSKFMDTSREESFNRFTICFFSILGTVNMTRGFS